jgi:hypothetical protein
MAYTAAVVGMLIDAAAASLWPVDVVTDAPPTKIAIEASLFVTRTPRRVERTATSCVADTLLTVTWVGAKLAAPDSAGLTGSGFVESTLNPFSSVKTAEIGLFVKMLISILF